jgi:hypothetical protein
VSTGTAPSLQVAHLDEPTRIIWDGSVAGGFLLGGTAGTTIDENTTPASGFRIEDTELVRYSSQPIDSAVVTLAEREL